MARPIYVLEGQQLRLIRDLAELTIQSMPLVQSHPGRRLVEVVNQILADGADGLAHD